MARSKQKDEWSRCSSLLAMLHNCNSKETKGPNDFNPFTQESRVVKVSGLRDLMPMIRAASRRA